MGRGPSSPRLGRLPVLLALVPAGCGCGDDAGGDDAAGSGDEPAGPAWFADEAGERGLRFTLSSGQEPGRFLFPEIMCGGAALFDPDGDGDLDAYLVQAGRIEDPRGSRPPNRLFRNDGGRFTDVTEASGTGDRGYGMGACVGDVDGDGDPDLHVSNLEANTLLVNRDGSTFEDRTEAAGVGDASWSVSACFFDPDLDGDLDLFVANYVQWTLADEILCDGLHTGRDYCSPKAYDAPSPDTLYRNEGDGTFTDVSSEARLRTAYGNGLGCISADFDLNGLPDLFVANDGTPNQLWLNQGDGTFRDESLLYGCAVDDDGGAKAGMGVAAADLDGDLDEDLLVVNMAREADSLHIAEGSYFSDRTAVMGLTVASRPFTRFGVGLLDFDNDGRVDLFEANGKVVRAVDSPEGDPYAEEDLLFRGLGSAGFEEVLPRGGTRARLAATSRAAAFGDVDGDGGIDVLIANRDAPAMLLRNVYPARGSWVRFRVLDEEGRDAVGAAVVVRAGDLRLRGTVRSGYSYGAANDLRVHFGLGAAATVDDVRVTWPDGASESFGALPAGATHVLARTAPRAGPGTSGGGG